MNRFNDVLDGMIKQNIPFFIYRLPNQEQINCGYQIIPTVKKESIDSLNDSRGFLFAPFEGDMCYNIIPHKIVDVSKSLRCLEEDIKHLDFICDQGMVEGEEETNYEKYLIRCNRYISEIVSGEIEKAILSRAIKDKRLKKKNASSVFNKLLEKYPDAYVFLVNIPGVTTWIGASPEILLETENLYFRTYSLAGTQRWITGFTEKVENWSSKDINEQAIVTEYIYQNLAKKGVSQMNVSSLNVKRAGEIGHLLTIIEGNLNGNKVTDLVSVLHPTPAVCGSPRNKALQIIEKNEGYCRKFYTGFLGYFDEVKTQLYVNLRCARLDDEFGYLYVGGGITKESEPEQEWLETCMKANTILNALD